MSGSQTRIDDDLNVLDDQSPSGSCVGVGTLATSGESDRSFAGADQGTLTIRWDDGQRSTAKYTVTATTDGITDNGSITSGEFAGDTFTEQLAGTSPDYAETVRITPPLVPA